MQKVCLSDQVSSTQSCGAWMCLDINIAVSVSTRDVEVCVWVWVYVGICVWGFRAEKIFISCSLLASVIGLYLHENYLCLVELTYLENIAGCMIWLELSCH